MMGDWSWVLAFWFFMIQYIVAIGGVVLMVILVIAIFQLLFGKNGLDRNDT